MSDIKICSICLDEIKPCETENARKSYELPECQHEFHVECICHWFRSGHPECPECRHAGNGSRKKSVYGCDWRTISGYARRKNAPVEMKKKMKSFILKKDKEKEITAKIVEAKNQTGSYKEINSTVKDLNRKRWYCRRDMFSIKREIIALYPVTNLIIVTRENIK